MAWRQRACCAGGVGKEAKVGHPLRAHSTKSSNWSSASTD